MLWTLDGADINITRPGTILEHWQHNNRFNNSRVFSVKITILIITFTNVWSLCCFERCWQLTDEDTGAQLVGGCVALTSHWSAWRVNRLWMVGWINEFDAPKGILDFSIFKIISVIFYSLFLLFYSSVGFLLVFYQSAVGFLAVFS